MLFREFEIIEMRPSEPTRTKKVLTPEQLAEQAERRAKRKRGKKERQDGDAPDATEDEEEEDELEAQGERFDISMSSEYPVARWFGTEILDHSPGAVDLSRAKLGLSFLDSHIAEAVIGIVENVSVVWVDRAKLTDFIPAGTIFPPILKALEAAEA